MDPLQAWLVVGLPALAIVAGMFARRSPLLTAIGYLVLAVTFIFFLVVPEDPVSASAVGIGAILLVASGRGGAEETEEEHVEMPMWLDASGAPAPPDAAGS